jgi:uncharacterized protein
MKIEEPKIKQIQELCKASNVKSLFAFGSVTREDFNENPRCRANLSSG